MGRESEWYLEKVQGLPCGISHTYLVGKPGGAAVCPSHTQDHPCTPRRIPANLIIPLLITFPLCCPWNYKYHSLKLGTSRTECGNFVNK
ncbi:hypothetical protein Y1Q_0004174 [Alligator mississippiensis]|uniref:Uncharacterized protein n=1 Tax=Alligator mississippiensis TaxID=8496 RepID=A0A151PI97_ALLMI|nr:hypothetical protein Y1Q_0004174 [Alligator mississippiensis]